MTTSAQVHDVIEWLHREARKAKALSTLGNLLIVCVCVYEYFQLTNFAIVMLWT